MKMKFIKDKDIDYNPHDTVDVEVRIEAEGIADVIEAFANFLKACGYSESLVKEYLGEEE